MAVLPVTLSATQRVAGAGWNAGNTLLVAVI